MTAQIIPLSIFLCVITIVISGENVNELADTFKFVDDAQIKLQLANHSDVILLIGNTGTGKSTLGHYLTGNLNKLKSIIPEEDSDDYIIQDDLDLEQNRKTSPTESRTLIPELLEDEEHQLWYDCPGFGDTRNSTVEIATTFLIKNLIESASRAKLVLVTDYASVTTSRSDFDELLNRTTQLVQNIDHFHRSISLVVTKVPPYKFRHMMAIERFEDSVKNKTVKFIRGHHEYLLANGGNMKKIQLIDALLVGQNGDYPQISVFWRPTGSGTFDKLPKMVEGRQKIRHSVMHRPYAEIRSGDFGYPLTAEGKLYTTQMVTLIKENIHTFMANLVDQMKNEIEKKIIGANSYDEKIKLINKGRYICISSSPELLSLQYLADKFRALVTELELPIQIEHFTNIARHGINLGTLNNLIDITDGEAMSPRDCKTFLQQIAPIFEHWDLKIQIQIQREVSSMIVNTFNNLTAINEAMSRSLQRNLRTINDTQTMLDFLEIVRESIGTFDSSTKLTDIVGNLSSLIYESELRSNDQSQIVQLISDETVKIMNKELLIAAKEGHLSVVKYLIVRGADKNFEDINGETALHVAAWNRHLDIVKYLVESGADKNVKDNDGRTAMCKASYQGELNIVKYLLENGADFRAEDDFGETALHMAAWTGHLDVVAYLVEKGASIHIMGNNGFTALHRASWNGHLNVVKYLVANGADINENGNGFTPLIRATYNGHLDVVKYLIEKGVYVNDTRYGEGSALDFALSKGHAEVAKVLKNAGGKAFKEFDKYKEILKFPIEE